ncbi:HEAT repeat domain-containing protein [Kitasatospora cathayae]|uniref:HEAT repeat domain-containing protein n=1 Tax=Kitasatospora cathayae TaxID=3004092 RepID=A0ABY7PX79_9ACTN|nr:HEAT repeat domain-containing protein [Kitasatospora sp. HUAS 3-15]WBP85052.1 HEAT repeat domain-containing protein [Kitasatospora sp. HUAS 3-15]
MGEELDAIDWAALRHNHGSARDVPGLLRRCAGPDRQDAAEAVGRLDAAVFHQGGWICSAAPAVLPYLVELAARPESPIRLDVLELLTNLCDTAALVAEERVDRAWGPAWERALPELLRLLADPDPAIRRAVADALGRCASPGELTLPALLTCWDAEQDPGTRLDLVLALGHAAGQQPTGHRGAETLALLHGLLDDPEPQLRLAAVHALAPTDPGLAPRHLDVVLEALRDPSVELWRQTSAAGCGVFGMQSWTADFYPGPSPSYALGLLADHPDPEQRASALSVAGALLSHRRSPTPLLLPDIAARLADPVPEVRYRATELLACLGPAAADHRDAVAELLDDPGTFRSYGTVADAAVWALARMGDPRCVPALVDRLTGPRLGFDSSSSRHSRLGNSHWPHLPALHELLIPLREHAEELVPAIGVRLRADHPLVRSLCEVLAAWGPVAEAALRDLLALLDGESTWTHAATALAGIGPAGNAAHDALRSRAAAGGRDAALAAWSAYRVGGEPGPALALLGPAATEGRFPAPALRRLADLGPYAAPYADRLRELTADPDHWTSVEAAHALWSATGDADTTVPALLAVCRPLLQGSYLPAMLAAVRHLARIGPAAHPAVTVLAEALPRDERLTTSTGWPAFVEDDTVRAAITDLLAPAHRGPAH